MPFKAYGFTQSFDLYKATDRVCYSLDGPECANDVEFLTTMDWMYYNFLGVAPLDS